MSFFSWDQKFDIGVKGMNDEHQTLIAIMNRLHERDAAGADHVELRNILNELATYAVKHFADEEAYMASIDYPELEKHKIIHQQLLAQFKVHADRFEEGGGSVGPGLFAFLSLWLSAHIQGIDIKYGLFSQTQRKAS